MIFNSLDFLFFLVAVFSLYWIIGGQRRRSQNVLLLIASYLFYGWWDPRFLGLIIASSVIDYTIAMVLQRSDRTMLRRVLLGTSVVFNLGILAIFKYLDFFADSFVTMASTIGWTPSWISLNLVLPVGISFYTFQTMSYTIDVYRRQLKAEREPIAFFTYVAFFPQLVAGPIERASHLLPQFQGERRFDQAAAADGCRQMLWGFFKKVIVAEAAGRIADGTFGQPGGLSSGILLLGAVAFTIQIYCDFSGYSDIAIGVSRLFGFSLRANFRYPLFSRDLSEFWQRWHISLSSWFRDYVYFPLGGNRHGKWRTGINVTVVFLISGLWHGANWTFIVWGGIHALGLLLLILLGRQARGDIIAKDRYLPTSRDSVGWLLTFTTVVCAFIFFRANSLGDGFNYLHGIFSFSGWGELDEIRRIGLPTKCLGQLGAACAVLLAIEWLQRDCRHGLDLIRLPAWRRWAMYYPLTFAVLSGFAGERPFIYFQF